MAKRVKQGREGVKERGGGREEEEPTLSSFPQSLDWPYLVHPHRFKFPSVFIIYLTAAYCVVGGCVYSILT